MPFQFVKSSVIMKLFVLLICFYSAESLKCQVKVIGSKEYVGCFIDTDIRLLPHRYLLENGTFPLEMENNMCFLYCKEHGYMYSGTEHAECWCGDDPYRYGRDDIVDVARFIGNSDCNEKCSSDSKQICGGRWRLSVYETGYLPYKQDRIQYKLVSNNTILMASANQVLPSTSTIECAHHCKLSDNCKVFVISTETEECSLYDNYTSVCEKVRYTEAFQVYMMQ